MATAFGTLGTIETLTMGGRVFVDVATLIMLGGNATGTAYTTLRKPNGTSGYQVTNGKTYGILAFDAFNNGGAAAGNMSLLYGDNDVGVAGSAPTTPIYMGGTLGNHIIYSEAGGLMQKQGAFSTPFNVLSQKYPAMYMSGNQGQVFVYGYET